MADALAATTATEDSPIIDPRILLLAGMGGMILGAVTAPWATGALGWLPPAALFVAGATVGGAVASNARSPIVLGLAALASLIGSFGFAALGWDSAVLLYRVLTVVAGAGAVLALLPLAWRCVVASLLILVHFGGILSAVTSAPPTAWLSNVAWVYFYRPYLSFTYMNNAYHFYAPEPGPAFLLWFLVEYEKDADGRHWRWIKVPDLARDGRPLRPGGRRLWPNVEYTRRLSLAQYGGMSDGTQMMTDIAQRRRLIAGQRRDIPVSPNVPIAAQYHVPSPTSRFVLREYVRHVASTYRDEKNPELQVRTIKAYYVVHQLVPQTMIADGSPPDDPPLFRPIYLGEFDRDGNYTRYLDPDEPSSAEDPFLYWEIPIVRDGSGKVINYVLKHANVPDEAAIP